MSVGAKIGIIGDVHIGSSVNLGKPHPILNINTRLLDYSETLEFTINDMINSGVTEIVFTGDIFEHRYPSSVHQKIFSQHIYTALSSGIDKIHIVIGNHDQQRANAVSTLSYLKELQLPNVIVYDEISLTKFKHFDKDIANLVFLPYRDRLWFAAADADAAIAILRQQLNEVLSTRDPTLPTILVGHMAIEGTAFDDDDQELYSIDKEFFVPRDMFSDCDVVIMGHIHKPDIIQTTKPYMAYIGSMEKRAGHEQHDKLYAIVDAEDATVDFFKGPCRDIHDIVLDYTSVTLKESLMDRIRTDMDDAAGRRNLGRAIVRGIVRITAEDEHFCDTSIILQYMVDKYGAHFGSSVKKDIFSSRQSRDERITETISHVAALQIFLDNTVENAEVRKMLLEAGLEIIKSNGDKNAASQA